MTTTTLRLVPTAANRYDVFRGATFLASVTITPRTKKSINVIVHEGMLHADERRQLPTLYRAEMCA